MRIAAGGLLSPPTKPPPAQTGKGRKAQTAARISWQKAMQSVLLFQSGVPKGKDRVPQLGIAIFARKRGVIDRVHG